MSDLVRWDWASKLPLQVNSLLLKKPKKARVKAAHNIDESDVVENGNGNGVADPL